MSKEWEEIIFSRNLKISIPARMIKTQMQAIDSDFHEWKGKGILVRLDAGLFSDSLTSYEKQNGYTSFDEEIAGHTAKIVSFDKVDGTHFVGVHFANLSSSSHAGPQKLTVVVELSQSMDIDIAFSIIKSIQFVR